MVRWGRCWDLEGVVSYDVLDYRRESGGVTNLKRRVVVAVP